jgi:hypothetical protein
MMHQSNRAVAGGRAGLIAVVLALCLCAGAEAKTLIHLGDRDRAVYDSLHHATIDEERCYAVRPGTVWSTELGDYHFESGCIAFFATVAGHPTGCMFRGDARLHYSPPPVIERQQLDRFCGDTILNAELDLAYMRFFDTAMVQGLMACLDTHTVSFPRTKRNPKWFEKTAMKELYLDFGMQGWEMLANAGRMPDWLYICPMLRGQKRMHFLLDETAREAITVWRRPGGTPGVNVLDLVCSYDRERTPEGKDAFRALAHGGIDIAHYDSHVWLDNAGRMKLDVSMRCQCRRDGQVAVVLAMAPGLEIDSIAVAGRHAPFLYDEEGGMLLARAPAPLTAGDSLGVRLWYRGEHLLEKLYWGDFYIKHTTRWLPKTAPRQRSTYVTRFECPKFYEIVSVGQPLLDTIVDDRHISEWRTYGPEAYVSFNYGSFERLDLQMENGPDLWIYRGKNHRGGLFSGDFKKTVAASIEGAVRLFSKIFRPYPWDHLAATEIPASHGQGFPQLLHLAWVSFDSERKGITDAFRAHEVAHQWFGHIVGWDTYHDQWLSEAFAEYAGGLYLQASYPGNDEFFDQLKQWRDDVLERGGHTAWHEGPQVAPIWLGRRCSSYRSPASYHNIVYAKGAYVLHMLRQMLHDYKTGSDRRFFWMISDYIDRYAGSDASTEDFRRVVEAHCHQDMGWFFDQWVYCTQIPRFKYHWEREEQPDGRWIVRGRIEQSEADPPFRVYMPITIEFEDGKTTILQEISETLTEFQTRPFPNRPKDCQFNDFYTVLCRE